MAYHTYSIENNIKLQKMLCIMLSIYKYAELVITWLLSMSSQKLLYVGTPLRVLISQDVQRRCLVSDLSLHLFYTLYSNSSHDIDTRNPGLWFSHPFSPSAPSACCYTAASLMLRYPVQRPVQLQSYLVGHDRGSYS